MAAVVVAKQYSQVIWRNEGATEIQVPVVHWQRLHAFLSSSHHPKGMTFGLCICGCQTALKCMANVAPSSLRGVRSAPKKGAMIIVPRKSELHAH